MTMRIRQLTCSIAVVAAFALAAPLQAQSLVLDDPLQGSSIALGRSGDTFADGGWKVTAKSDYLLWHVPRITTGAVEFDVKGVRARECGAGMRDIAELFHMYDNTFQDADNVYGGYSANPYKHFIRKTGGGYWEEIPQGSGNWVFIDCRGHAKTDSMEIVWKVCPNNDESCRDNLAEGDTSVLSWDPDVSYHFCQTWESNGSTATLRTYRDGVLLLSQTVDGTYACGLGDDEPYPQSIRIAASNRPNADSGPPIGAVYSNVKVWNGAHPCVCPVPPAPWITSPVEDETVRGPQTIIEWTGGTHTHYQVRVNATNNPDGTVVWDSGEVSSGVYYASTGQLSDQATCYAFVRVRNCGVWGPWSPGRSFTVNSVFDFQCPTVVEVAGTSLQDCYGPFLGLGATYMRALRFCKYDRARFEHDCSVLASGGFSYLRALSMVSWTGLEIVPPPVTYNGIPGWSDYDQQVRDMIDLAYDNYGLRTQLTIFADAQNVMPSDSDRMNHLDRILSIVKTPDANNPQGREHKIVLLEVANEGWKNGFSDDDAGVADIRAKGLYLAERTTVPVALTSPSPVNAAGIHLQYAGSAADIATAHFSRDLAENGWNPVHDCWYAAHLPGVPPASSNEPIGAGSSGNSENDPLRLVSAAYFAFLANLPMYVYHSRAGTTGRVDGGDQDVTFEESAGIDAYRHVLELLPPDVSSWARNDGIEAAAPFTVFCNGEPNKYWTDVSGATSGCNRNIGVTKGNDFVCYPMGILGGGLTLQARRPVSCIAYDPLTGEAVYNLSLNTGQQFTLAQGSGAYLIKTLMSSGEISIDLGEPDVQHCMALMPVGDGDTIVTGNIGGRTCRRNADPNAPVPGDRDYYFYFAVCDSFASQCSRPELWVTFDYFDFETGTISIQYDSCPGTGQPGGDPTHYVSGGSVPLTGSNTWKHATFHLTDAGFGNGQNGGADFRFGKTGGFFYIDKVRVTPEEPKAPVIAEVAPDPKILIVGTAYVEQLSLTQGTLPVTWSVIQGPSGLETSASGLVSGWTPTVAGLGMHTIEIGGANFMDSDIEAWVVHVVSDKDFDFDGDVDQEDFGVFQRCLSGNGVGYGAGCAPADLDTNGTVDQSDFDLFWQCLSGPGQSPGC